MTARLHIQRCLSYLVLMGLGTMLAVSLFSMQVFASGGGSGGPAADTNCPEVNSTNPASACNSCINSIVYENLASGGEIIDAMFTAINSVLSKVQKSFFEGVVGAADFQAVIGTAMILYVAIYGIIITLNLGTYRVNEVATRLVKVAFVYMLTSPTAWSSFNTWVHIPVVDGMNQLIRDFTEVAQGGSSSITTVNIPYGTGGSGGLDVGAFSQMFGESMTIVFSVQLLTAILSMMQHHWFGWFIAAVLAWALVEFLLMMIGAVITYAKAIIGLAFLFSLFPIFVIFFLFDNTRKIAFNIVFQIIAFAIQPVILFAFLAFYVALINAAAPFLLTDDAQNKTNFCWTKWFSLPGSLFDVFAWRPTSMGTAHPGSWSQPVTGKVLDSPINVPNAVYFCMLCYLGCTFTKFIETLSNDIAGGIGPGIVRGQDIAAWAKRGVGGAVRGIRGK